MALFSLNPGERLIIKLHRHPIVLLFESLPFLLLLLLPIVAFFTLYAMGLELEFNLLSSSLLILLTSSYYAYTWLFLVYVYFDFILDAWVVTSERIINVEQKGLFSRASAEQEITRVQDVTAEVKGILPTIFGYGDVYIQTAGEKEHFVFRQVCDPQGVVRAISQVVEDAKQV